MNKTRKLIVFLTVALMVLALVPGAALAGADEDRVEFFINETTFTVNDEEDEMDVAPFIRDGRTFIPVRFLAQSLGAEADWEPKDSRVETVTLDRADRLVTIHIGYYELTVLDKQTEEEFSVDFDAAALIEDGRTFLPFRAVAESLGAEVDYAVDDDGLVTQVWFTQEAVEPDPDPDPEPEEVTVDSMEQKYYWAGDTMAFTIRGMDPETEISIYFVIMPERHGDLNILTHMEDGAITGTTDEDGTFTVEGEVAEDLPEGEVHIIIPEYGFNIDNTLILRSDGQHVTLAESYPANFYVMDDTTVDYPGPIDGAAVLVYEDEDLTVEVAELTTDEDGMTQTKLVDGEYWFTVTAVDHPDYEGSFTVEGQEEHVFVGMDE